MEAKLSYYQRNREMILEKICAKEGRVRVPREFIPPDERKEHKREYHQQWRDRHPNYDVDQMKRRRREAKLAKGYDQLVEPDSTVLSFD